MKVYLSVFGMVGLTVGLVLFTWLFLRDTGMSYPQYRGLLTVLLSFTSFISNAAVGYYFHHKPGGSGDQDPPVSPQRH